MKKNCPPMWFRTMFSLVLLLTVFYNLIAVKPNWLANFQIIILITLGFFWSTSYLIFFSFSGTLLISMGFRIINLVHFLATCIRVAAVVPGNGSLDFFQQNFRWEINLNQVCSFYLLKNKISYSAKKTIELMLILD